MATPPGQLIPTSKVEYLTRALGEATDREEYRKLLQVSIGMHSKAEAEVRRLEELCCGLKRNAGMWENMYHREIFTQKADEAYFRCAKAEKVRLEEKVKLLQQGLYAKHVKPVDLLVMVEHIHIEILQTENADLLKNQEKMEVELSSATRLLQHVTATVLALVAELEKSQMNVGRQRQRPAELSMHEDLTSSNPLELHSKMAFYESIRSAEAALLDATRVCKRVQSAAECMLTVGRKTVLDKILGRAEARE